MKPSYFSSVFLLIVGFSFWMLAGPANSQDIQPGHAAMWIAPDRDGEGWVLEVLNDDLALMYWFTYDEQGGQRWMISEGEIQDGQIVFPELLMPRGGVFGDGFDPDLIVNEVVGQAAMSFTDCDQGHFEYEAFGQSESLTIQRLTRTDGLPCDGLANETTNFRARFSGSWFDPSHSGEGYVLQWMSSGAALLVWFTYDADGESYWMIDVGHPVGDELVFPEMLATRGARFGQDFVQEDVERYLWGELRLTLGCEAGVASYSSIFPEFGSGQLNLRPLTRPNGIDCDDAIGTWSSNGPFGGSVSFLEISPHMPERIYAAPTRRGLFRSDDEGQTWRELAGELENRTIQALAVAPADADTVYVSTSVGLMKSTDGGRSWIHLEPDPTMAISGRLTIAINPDNANDVTVAAPNRGGLYRSSDGGASWARLDQGFFDGIQTFAFWPGNRDLIIAVDRRSGGQGPIYRSANGGLDWDAVQPDPRLTASGRIELAERADGSLLLFASRGHSLQIRNAVLESHDEGQSWTMLARNCPEPEALASVRAFKADSVDKDAWYFGGGNGVIRVSDSGQSCAVVSSGMTTAGFPDLEAEVFTLKAKPGDSNVLYATTRHAGVFRSGDGGESWEQLNEGLSRTEIRALAAHPDNPDIVVAGYGDGYAPGDALWISTDAGETWTASAQGLGIVGVRGVVIDPSSSGTADEAHMYAVGWGWQITGLSGGVQEGSAGVFKSVDGGRSWFDSGNGIALRDFENTLTWGDFNMPVMRSIILVPSSDGGPSQTLYVAGNGQMEFDSSAGGCFPQGHRIYKSNNAGETWFPADEGLPFVCDRALQANPLVIDPTDPQTLYVGTFLSWSQRTPIPMPIPEFESGVFKSIDGGESWSLHSHGLPRFDSDNPDSSYWDVNALAVAPSMPNVVYAALRRSFHIGEGFKPLPRPTALYKTLDGGANWSPADNGLPAGLDVRAIAIDPDDNETVYLANIAPAAGPPVFRSTDGGASWAPYDDELSGRAYVLMKNRRDSSAVLHVGTDAGVFSIRHRE